MLFFNPLKVLCPRQKPVYAFNIITLLLSGRVIECDLFRFYVSSWYTYSTRRRAGSPWKVPLCILFLCCLLSLKIIDWLQGVVSRALRGLCNQSQHLLFFLIPKAVLHNFCRATRVDVVCRRIKFWPNMKSCVLHEGFWQETTEVNMGQKMFCYYFENVATWIIIAIKITTNQLPVLLWLLPSLLHLV